MLHVSSMLSEGEYCVTAQKHSRLQYLGITHAHTHTWLPPHYTRITQKGITYATSTVALLDKYNYNLNDNTP